MSDREIATFARRDACIGCGSARLRELSSGKFDEGAVGRFIDDDPWGEHPAPFLRGQRWSYVACDDCGLAFHRCILSPEWNERRFSKWMSQEAIAAFEKRFATPDHRFGRAAEHTAHVLRIERLTRDVRGSAAPRVLDFGCGSGDFLSVCSFYGFDAYGVDRSAAKRDNASFDRVFAGIDDVTDKAPFHAVTLFEVLEHLDDPRGLMLRLSELLVPGGVLILETPDCTGVRGIETRSDYDKIHPLDHINGFTPATLSGFAERLGFAPVIAPISCVAAETKHIAKAIAKRLIAAGAKPTTQQYFRKLAR